MKIGDKVRNLNPIKSGETTYTEDGSDVVPVGTVGTVHSTYWKKPQIKFPVDAFFHKNPITSLVVSMGIEEIEIYVEQTDVDQKVEAIRKRLIEARKRTGMNAEEAAESFGYEWGKTILNNEKGHQVLRVDFVLKAAQVYKVSANWLFTGE